MSSQGHDWKDSLHSFFDQRGRAISSQPDFEELCFVSGRDPRLWRDRALYDDLIISILEAIRADSGSYVVEVGCAAGFLAYGVAARVGCYQGIDLAAHALTAARRLALPNARFLQGDARTLPLPDASVDGVFCYDVVTNFPTFDDYSGLIDEMLRIVKPGGRVLVGSVPDRAVQAGYEARVLQFAAELERLAGPPLAGPPAPSPSFLERVLTRFGAKRETPPASISCYYFDRSDFEAFAAKLGVGLTITDIHPLNPYAGYRFNAIFQRAN